MPYIKKLVMKGFKSFASETEIPFQNSMNVIVGPNGSGKCLVGESIIQLGDGSLKKIDEIVNSRLDKAVKTEDGFLIQADGTEIMCLDFKTLKTQKKPIKAFIKRTSPNKLLRIRTRSGKQVKVTNYHPLFILKDGEVIATRADELKQGIRIAIPRKINFDPEHRYFTELLDKTEENDRIYIPYREEYKLIIKSLKKNLTWKKLAEKIGFSYYVIKGLLDKQSINLFHLIKIMKTASLTDMEIISLIDRFVSNGVETLFSFKNSEEFSRFFGYLLAEGRLAESSQIWFTNGDSEIVEDYISLVKKLFNKEPLVREYKAGCWDVIIYSEPLKKILAKLGMASKTEEKEISNIILKHSGNKEISSLLNGLYCGDGYISNRSIEITTKSSKLAKGIESCLLRLGIIFKERKTIKRIKERNFSGKYFDIIIYGVNNFLIFNSNIKLIHNKKREKILSYLNKKSNPNLDLIEVNALVKQIAIEQGINIKKLKKEFPRIDAYCYSQCSPSRAGLTLLRKNLLNKNSESTIILDKLITSDIYWDEVVEIEEIPGEEWVYDLCVEENHNFIANNIFVHNSNIADAVCFVLGRLSIKSIRAAKSANLIFSGTKTHKPAGIASVKLVFDNSDKGFFLAQKEVTIERIVKKSGQSIYRINDETKTRQEVLELLAQAGIDPHGFNIILQGTINDLVKATSEERRKIIEQVAGISVYEVRKEKSLHELEKTDAKLKEISAVLRERTAYLRNLEQERQQALKFKQLEKLVQRCKASIIHKKLHEKKKEIEKIKLSLDKLESQKQKIRKELNLVQDNITSLEQQIEDINKKIQASTGIVQEKLYAQLTELREDLAGLEVHKQNSERKLEETLSRRQRADKDVKEFQIQIQDLRKKSPLQAKKQSQLEQKKKDFEELEQERKKFYTIKTKLEAIRQRIDDKKSQLQKNNNETSFILKQINELEASLKFNSEEKAGNRLDELRKELINTFSKLEQAEKDKLTLEKQLSVSEVELANLDKIKKQVSKLDICPLCKSKITEEHLKHVYQDCDEKIQYNQDLLIKTRNNLENINKEITSLKSSQENLRKEISTLGIQIIKLENLTQQTLVIKRLENERKELQETLQTLEQEKKTHEALQLKFRDVEGKYEQTLLEIEEISARTEENIDLELELKERDLERTKLIIKQSHRDQEELEQELKDIEKEINEKSSSLQELEQQEKTLQAKYKKLFEERESLQENIHIYNKESLEKQNNLNLSENEANNLKVEKAKLDAESETLEIDLETYKSAEIIQASLEILQEKLIKTEQTLAIIGSVNLRALEVYDEIKKEYDEVANKAADLLKEKEEILKIIEEIDKKKKKTFIRTLKAINELFSRNFSQLSNKGQVFLNIETPKPKDDADQKSTENQEDVFAGGLGITVKIGQGKYFDVTSLSGGEQTLVSLSLLFAIQEYKPYSFYIFDEVDAALDKRNSERLASLIKKYMKTGQYIIVTHNDAIITESTLLYGVSMQDGISKILSLEV